MPENVRRKKTNGPVLRQARTVQRYLSRLRRLERDLHRLQEQRESVRLALVECLAEGPLEQVEAPGLGVATLVRSSNTVLDERVLREHLGPEVWSTISKVDRTALAAAVRKGTVPGVVVAQASRTEPRSPYVRVLWEVDEKDDEEGSDDGDD